jgi:FkbH-like protein
MKETRNGRRIALLSNVNMNALIRMLQKDAEVYEAEGYGNELGILMNPASSYHAFQPEMTFLVVDILELLEHELEEQAVRSRIQGWFAAFENAMSESCVYYINDAFLWGVELEAADALTDSTVPEGIWNAELKVMCARHANVRILPYHRLISKLGEENAFSPKMWYMGRILLSGEAQKRLAALILDKVELESRTPKKVLVLDLDNTLWGGLAGENDHTPIQLSEEHSGLAYKNLQRVILQMQKQGVLLAIVSKNNPEDAEVILQGHPHMVLRPEHFAAKRINWKPKNENMMEIAGELNLGVDSFVFWDDNPQERLLISQTLPQVAVPDFPAKPEELAPAMTTVYHDYFEKAVLTAEDLNKTVQYAANNRRRELQQAAGNFTDYLKQLQIVVTRVDAAAHFNRLEALLNKTNQFNLTTRRHDTTELQNLIQNQAKRIFLYRVEDCFGDNGLVAAVIVDAAGTVPVIEEFVMSCRVMGKNIEQGILSHVETCLREEGFECVRGVYVPTAKNKPVAGLYEQMGYCAIQDGTADSAEQVYELTLSETPERAFVGKICTET